MKKNKILVLSNLDSSTENILKSAVSLAKMIGGEIAVFSVTKPTEIVKRESQLSAMRTINSKHAATGKKMKNLITPITKNYDLNIKHSFAFGNVKSEIKNYIDEQKPDIIVLGKRKSSPLQLIGDGITQYVIKTFKGEIMIVGDNNSLEPNKEISLGMLNNIAPLENLKFAEDLLAHSKSSLKSFKIVKKLSAFEEHNPVNKKTVEYVFEHNDSSIQSLSNYVTKSNTNLLYLNRMKKQDDNLMVSDIKNLVNKINVTLLVSTE